MSDPATSADIAALIKEVHGVHNDIVYQAGLIGKKLDALLAGGMSAPASGSTVSTGSTSAVDATAAKYFPADSGNAAFPSPENSRISRTASGISGKPYLLDSSGTEHRLVPSTAATPNGYTVNGARTGGGGNEELFNVAIVRQGKVFVQRSTGQWQQFNPGMGSIYNAALPDAYQTDASGATTSPVAASSAKAPALPTPMSPAPGTSGKTLAVGAGKAFATITDAVKAASAGDTVAIDAGAYKETPPAISKSLKLIGVGGRAVIDCTGLTGSLAYGKGGLVPTADCIIENIRVTGVAMDQKGAQLTSGVRPDVGCGYLTLNNVELDGNQSGLGTGGDIVVKVVVNGGRFHNNGLPATLDASGNVVDDHGRGYTHNIYTGAGTSLTLNNLTSDDPAGGHPVKHRGWELVVSGGTFGGAMDAAVFDIPNGSIAQAVIDGASMTKPAGAYNHAVIDYATDDTSSGNGGLLIKNSTINALCDNPFFLVGSGSVITIDASTKVTGTKPTAQGGTVKGL